MHTKWGTLTVLQTTTSKPRHGQLEGSKDQSVDWTDESGFDVDLLIRRLEHHKLQVKALAANRLSQRRELYHFEGSTGGAAFAAHGSVPTNKPKIGRRIPEALIIVPMAQATTQQRTQISPSSPYPPRSASLWQSGTDQHHQVMGARPRNELNWPRENSAPGYPITLPGPMHHVRIHSASPKLSGEMQRGLFANHTTRTHSRSMTVPGLQTQNFSPTRTLVSTPVDHQFLPDSPATLVAPDDPTQLKEELLAMGDSDDDRVQREIELLSLTNGPSLLERRKIGRGRSGPMHLNTERHHKVQVSAPMSTPIQPNFNFYEEQNQHAITSAPGQAKPRRKFSLFRPRGRSRIEIETDDLIEMYMTEEQLDEMRPPKTKKRAGGLARTWTWRRRKASVQKIATIRTSAYDGQW